MPNDKTQCPTNSPAEHTPEIKTCHKCRDHKAKDQFEPNNDRDDGLNIYCKNCMGSLQQEERDNVKLWQKNQRIRFHVQTDKSFSEMFPDDPTYGRLEISLPLTSSPGRDWFKVGVSFPDAFKLHGTHMGASLTWEQAKWIKHVILVHDDLLRQRDALLEALKETMDKPTLGINAMTIAQAMEIRKLIQACEDSNE